jgi:hypothetical protein
MGISGGNRNPYNLFVSEYLKMIILKHSNYTFMNLVIKLIPSFYKHLSTRICNETWGKTIQVFIVKSLW